MTNRERLIDTAKRLLQAESDLCDGVIAFKGKLLREDEWISVARLSNETIRQCGTALARYTLAVDEACKKP